MFLCQNSAKVNKIQTYNKKTHSVSSMIMCIIILILDVGIEKQKTRRNLYSSPTSKIFNFGDCSGLHKEKEQKQELG